jgi:toxin secretion/phage lysis holin
MIQWLGNWLSTDNTKLIYILSLILIANMIDFLIGWVNAKFNKSVPFSSSKAIYGIARKIVLFILLIFFIPVALLVPEPIGISALYVLYIGYLLSELNSILSHLKISEDDKSTDRFIDFVNVIFKGGRKE